MKSISIWFSLFVFCFTIGCDKEQNESSLANKAEKPALFFSTQDNSQNHTTIAKQGDSSSLFASSQDGAMSQQAFFTNERAGFENQTGEVYIVSEDESSDSDEKHQIVRMIAQNFSLSKTDPQAIIPFECLQRHFYYTHNMAYPFNAETVELAVENSYGGKIPYQLSKADFKHFSLKALSNGYSYKFSLVVSPIFFEKHPELAEKTLYFSPKNKVLVPKVDSKVQEQLAYAQMVEKSYPQKTGPLLAKLDKLAENHSLDIFALTEIRQGILTLARSVTWSELSDLFDQPAHSGVTASESRLQTLIGEELVRKQEYQKLYQGLVALRQDKDLDPILKDFLDYTFEKLPKDFPVVTLYFNGTLSESLKDHMKLICHIEKRDDGVSLIQLKGKKLKGEKRKEKTAPKEEKPLDFSGYTEGSFVSPRRR